MKFRTILSLLLYLPVCAALGGCASDLEARFRDRYGPDVVLQTEEVAATIRRQREVMETFYQAAAATPRSAYPVSHSAIVDPVWFVATQMGMNYVDEKCDVYMTDLFKLNRMHKRDDGLLKSVNTATSAIVSVAAPQSRIALAVLAQSFGLAEGLNDSILKSYLFEEIPGLIADKVKEARQAYRDDVETLAKAKRITTEATAFKVVRNYLDLCLPSTIEGKFLSTYINSKTVAKTPDKAGQPTSTKPKPADSKSTNVTTKNVAQ